MPDDSRAPVAFVDTLREWSDDELRVHTCDRQFGEAIRAELERRARPCTCYLAGTVSHERYRQRRRECPQHQGRP